MATKTDDDLTSPMKTLDFVSLAWVIPILCKCFQETACLPTYANAGGR